MTDEKQRKVTIFGAGVAGLTVAHELAERGWSVTVYEPTPELFSRTRCAVGGMARTQWARLPAEGIGGWSDERMQEAMPASPQASWYEDERITFKPGTWTPDEPGQQHLDLVCKLFKGFATTHMAGDKYFWMEIHGYASREEAFRTSSDADTMHQDPAYVQLRMLRDEALAELEKQFPDPGPHDSAPNDMINAYFMDRRADLLLSIVRSLKVRASLIEVIPGPPDARLVLLPLALGDVDDPNTWDDDNILGRNHVSLRELRPVLSPGEHGYRYFPAFYHNLFDTMRRTRLMVRHVQTPQESARLLAWSRLFNTEISTYDQPMPPPRYEDTGRTAYDNLIPNDSFDIAGDDRRPPDTYSRTEITSLRALLSLVRELLQRRRTELGDLARFQLRLAVYLTSGQTRRAVYERQSWGEFLDVERFSEGFRENLTAFPKALIGLSSIEADARSIGSITVQLLLDQLRTTPMRDATLNGPTSVAWLDPWKRYLQVLGVKFEIGRLKSFETGQEDRVETAVLDDDRKLPFKEDEYAVVAVPVQEAQRICLNLNRQLKLAAGREDITKIAALPVEDPKAPDYPLRDFIGVQFYMDKPVFAGAGHTYFADAPWSLSSIQQSGYWADRETLNEAWDKFKPGELSVLSVDVGDLDAPGGKGDGEVARNCTAEEFAREVWSQISLGLSNGRWKPPEPLAWHVDEGVTFGAGSFKNKTPYLVNLAGQWSDRPGRLTGRDLCSEGPEPAEGKSAYSQVGEGSAPRRPRRLVELPGYDVQLDCLVFTGTYMKTYTRLATMEAANESGRHAANGLLRHWKKKKIVEPVEGDSNTESTSGDDRWHRPRSGRYGVSTGVLEDFATIHDVESDELPDLDWLKAIDDRLCEAGMPHLFDILGLEAWIDAAEPDGDALLDAIDLLAGGRLDPTAGLTQLLAGITRLWRGWLR